MQHKPQPVFATTQDQRDTSFSSIRRAQFRAKYALSFLMKAHNACPGSKREGSRALFACGRSIACSLGCHDVNEVRLTKKAYTERPLAYRGEWRKRVSDCEL